MRGSIATVLCACAALLAGAAAARASGTEVKGVIETQPVSPGDFMNPAFTGKIDINLHFPATRDADTGLLVVLHGIGTNFHRYDTECETWVNEYNVITVQVNYRGTGVPPPGYDFGKYQAIDTLRVVKHVVDTYAVNKQRIFLWGASGGGNVALHAAKMAPGTFALVAALAPITRPTTEEDRMLRGYGTDPAGGWETAMLGAGGRYTEEEWDIRDAQRLAPYLKRVPVYLLHGDADPVVDWQHSCDLHFALLAAGAAVAFITIQGGDHDFKGALDPTEDSRFKATEKYLRIPLLTQRGTGSLEQDLQRKITFPTRGAMAWPVKFDALGQASLDGIAKPGAVINVPMTQRIVKRGENLRFGLKIENWVQAPQHTVLLAGFVEMASAAVLPLLGPLPFLLPAAGVEGPVALPIPSAFPAGEYLFVAVVVGSAPAGYLDLDFFQFAVAAVP
ncbi:MAG: prolyl oligopeptidase family serine peptidase [Planctomycetes bacterium]|nr:prolyl oligopeptidase family serine peptidase [Planctomycetota bacterium]